MHYIRCVIIVHIILCAICYMVIYVRLHFDGMILRKNFPTANCHIMDALQRGHMASTIDVLWGRKRTFNLHPGRRWKPSFKQTQQNEI